jgi:hypothetical protein
MSRIGILAYGSLIREPGQVIAPLISWRIPTTTPFPVEYARLSRTRGGAPTVAPHPSGGHVIAELLVLFESVSLQEAKNILWRRETRKERSQASYVESAHSNAVLVRELAAYSGIDHVLFTDFNPEGKLLTPEAGALARAAIESVTKAPVGADGISYLAALIDDGVVTPLTAAYRDRILALSGCSNLADAISSLR